jgi:hypothetical protein
MRPSRGWYALDMRLLRRLRAAVFISFVASVFAGAATVGVLALVDRATVSSGLKAATAGFVTVLVRVLTRPKTEALAAAGTVHGIAR